MTDVGVAHKLQKRKKTNKQTHTNQRPNGPVMAHLISWPSISTKHKKSDNKWLSDFLVQVFSSGSQGELIVSVVVVVVNNV